MCCSIHVLRIDWLTSRSLATLGRWSPRLARAYWNALIDEVLDCLVVCVLCHFSSLSLAVRLQCMSCGAACKVTSRARDEGRIFRAGGRASTFRLGLIGPPYASRGRAGVCRLLRPVNAHLTYLVATGRHTPRNPQTRSSHPVVGVAPGVVLAVRSCNPPWHGARCT